MGSDEMYAVGPRPNSPERPRWWPQQCSRDRPPSPCPHAALHDHELPIPLWHNPVASRKEALRRRWLDAILPPLHRRGDSSKARCRASETARRTLLKCNKYLKNVPALVKTTSRLVTAGFHMFLTPVDTIKATMHWQTDGKAMVTILRSQVRLFYCPS